MTYNDICRRLTAAGIPDAELDAALLLEHFCAVGRASLPLRRDEDFDCAALAEAVERREARFPLQYLVGKWGFYGLEINTVPGVLIPRPDTEVIVEAAVRRLPRGGRFVDLGCGSGCIGAAILSARPDVTGIALDISEAALELTRRNAVALGLYDRLRILRGDMTAEPTWRALREAAPSGVDAVISNPPYIPTRELAELEPELAFEPASALDGGEDGLSFYRAVLPQAASLLAPGGAVIFECGAGQTSALVALAAERRLPAEVLWDLGGRDRGVVVG